MKVNNFAFVSLALASAMLLAACSTEGAFVHRPYEFDRGSADFPDGPILEDESLVTVCYRSRAATPDEIRELAAIECRKFGLVSKFEEQHYSDCPAVAPNAAVFMCTIESGLDRTFESPTSIIPPGAMQNPNGSREAAPRRGLAAEDVSTTAKSRPFPKFLLNPSPGN